MTKTHFNMTYCGYSKLANSGTALKTASSLEPISRKNGLESKIRTTHN